MAVEVATAYVSIVPSARNFTANLRREVGDQSALGRSMGDSAGNSFGSSFLGVARNVAASLAALFAIGKIVDVGKDAFNVAIDFEQIEVGFKTLIQDAALAERTLDDLREFARTTPFELPELADAGRKLLAFGTDADKLIPTLTKLGDLGAALGATSTDLNLVLRAIGQIGSKGRVQLEELNQIAEAFPGFNPIKALADGIGVSVSEFTTKLSEPGGALMAFGLTGAQAVDILIQKMGEFPGAAGAMDRQALTLGGSLNILKDTLRGIAIDALGPLLPGIATFVREQLVPPLEEFGEVLPGLLQSGIGGLSSGFDRLGQVVQIVTPHVVAVFDFVSRNSDVFGAAAAGLGGFIATAQGLSAISAVASGVGSVFSGIAGLAGVLSGAGGLVALGPVAVAAAAVLAVAAAFAFAYLKIEPFREAVDAVARVVRDVAVAAFERFADFLPAVGAALSAAASAVAGFALAVRDGAVGGFRAFVDAAAGVAGAVIDALRPLARWVDDNLVATFLAGADAVDAFVDLASTILSNFFSAVGDVAGWVADIVDLPNVFGALVDFVVDVVAPAFELAGRVISGLVDIVAALARVALPIVETFARGVWEVIEFAFKLVKNTVEAALGVLRGLFTLFAGVLRGDWQRVWDGLVTIVTSVFGNLYDILKALVSGVKDVLVAAFRNFPELVAALFDLVAAISSHLAGITAAVAAWIWEVVTQVIVPGMVSWAGALTEWFVTTAVPWLVEKSAVFAGTFLQWIIDAAVWVAEHVVAWAVALTDWVVTTALPWIVEHSAEFIAWFLDWVADSAVALAEKAVDLAVAITEWVVTKAIPWIVENSAKLLAKIIEWIGDAAVRVTTEAVKLGSAIVGWVVDEAAKMPGRLESLADAVFTWLRGMPDRIAEAASGMWDGLYEAFKSAINSIIGAWNGLSFSLPGFDNPVPGLPDFGGVTIHTPNVPYLADGGVITSPTLAMLAEVPRARPEIVTPERLMRQVVLDAIAEADSGGVAGTETIVVPVYLDRNKIAEAQVRRERSMK